MRGLLITLSLVAACAMAGCSPIGVSQTMRSGSDLKERDEIHQNYQLTPGARVEVAGISGAVKIETTDGDMAEVNVVRYAASRAALEHHKVLIDASPNNLTVRGERNSDSTVRSMLAHLFTRGNEVQQEVTLRLPRRVALFTNGINGRVMIGEISGPVSVHGVNGHIEIAQAQDHAEVAGVNGGVTMTLAQLGDKGVRISGVNGGIDLRLANDLNASFEVHGINGGVHSDAPDIVVQKEDRSNATAQIGKGGAPISLSGINGGVNLARIANTEARSQAIE